jgi:putative restriction endonuclease
MRRFTGRVALITGASRGIGLAIAERLVAEGARVCVTARQEQPLADAASYAYACAFCGFDGALGRNPVGLEAAHLRWHSQDGPDEVNNGLALCSLHHTLFDLGVLGLTPALHIQVSQHYVARSEAGQTVDALHRQPITAPRPGWPGLDPDYVVWHGLQVFKRPAAQAA